MPTQFELVDGAQKAISRAQELLTTSPSAGKIYPDLNAITLEMNEAFGLLETLKRLGTRQLSNRNVAIILAALRISQRNLHGLNIMPQMEEEKTDATEDEIDDLYEKINMGEADGFVSQEEYDGAVELLRQLQAGDVEDSIWLAVREIVEENDQYHAPKHVPDET